MATTKQDTRAHRRLPKVVRIAKTRPRLFISIAIGLAVIVILMRVTDWRTASALLVGWVVGAGLYLVLAFQVMAKADVHRMRRQARLQDEGRFGILVLTAFAALASLAAIFALLSTSHGNTRSMADLILATVTILISWAFTHT